MNTVWSRLVAVLVLVVVPIGAMIVVVAYDGLKATLDNLRATQVTATIGRASVVRSWLDSAGHTLANEGAAARLMDEEPCRRLAGTFVPRNPRFLAAQFRNSQGKICAAGELAGFSPPPGANFVEIGAGVLYSVVARDGRVWILARATGAAATDLLGVGLLRPQALTAQLQPLQALGETHVALLADDSQLVAQNDGKDVAPWIPEGAPPSNAEQGWEGKDFGGAQATFVAAPLTGTGLTALMRFDDPRMVNSRARFYIVCGMQLALLGLLVLAYAATVRRDIVRWISGIENAARARTRDPESQVQAPVDVKMPTELRSVADAFNTMAARAHEHQTALKASLADNRALMLEMHHRIKNSLQVIQSYLALIRRSSSPAEIRQLVRIESRISVLAIAYRMALTSGGIRAIAIEPFLTEIGATAITNLRGPQQLAELNIRWGGELDVDRAIPLGLGLVEALVAAFEGAGATHVAVALSTTDEDLVRLAVTADGTRDDRRPPQKIMNGLAAQLGAVNAAIPGLLLSWNFHP